MELIINKKYFISVPLNKEEKEILRKFGFSVYDIDINLKDFEIKLFSEMNSNFGNVIINYSLNLEDGFSFEKFKKYGNRVDLLEDLFLDQKDVRCLDQEELIKFQINPAMIEYNRFYFEKENKFFAYVKRNDKLEHKKFDSELLMFEWLLDESKELEEEMLVM